MEKENVFEVIMQADGEDIASLADELRTSIPHEVIKPPQQELVMFQVEESVEKIDFNVGEVLVTSAEIRVEDTIGYSMVMGNDDQKALDGALLMAVYEAGLSQKKSIEDLAVTLHAKMIRQLREEREIVSSTRVNFEVMGGQDPNIKHNVEENF
jgi:alpha-D-ribose 1-methylphosphonate 5-triphosphate synthase subunit PhnG